MCKCMAVFLPTYHATDHFEGAVKTAERTHVIVASVLC